MRYLILGAGPAGLTVANKLKELGITDFVVLEREGTAGGLCRSVEVDGSPFDIGGGHFLDVRRPTVNDFLFKFMPEEEWDKYNRDNSFISTVLVCSCSVSASLFSLSLCISSSRYGKWAKVSF